MSKNESVGQELINYKMRLPRRKAPPLKGMLRDRKY